MAEEKKEAAAAAPTDASSGGGGGGANKLVLILSLVNLIAVLVMAGILFISFKKDKAAVSTKDIHAKADHGTAAGDESKSGDHGDAKADAGGEHAAPEGGDHGDAKADAGGHGAGDKKSGKVFARVVTLDPFTVNLSSAGGASPKYVRVNVALEVPSQEVEDEVKQRTPQIRNIVIDLLNSKRTSDLTNYEGRESLKDEIRNAINSFLVSGRLKGVFFTNFAVSS